MHVKSVVFAKVTRTGASLHYCEIREVLSAILRDPYVTRREGRERVSDYIEIRK